MYLVVPPVMEPALQPQGHQRVSASGSSRLINRAPGTTIGSAAMGREREIDRGERRDRMLPERAAPDATEDAPAGH
jgi:hypothetical protein